MIARLGLRLAGWARRFVPDPLVFAILLSLITALLAWALTPSSPADVLAAWAGPHGLFKLLSFAMQMSLVLISGHALASTPQISRALSFLAQHSGGARRSTALVALVAVVSGLLNWGLGLIVGALFAREMGQRAEARGLKLHYPLLAAAGYTGLMVWHGGLSGSAPLTVTRSADLTKMLGAGLAQKIGVIPLDTTVLSARNIVLSLALILLIPLIVAALLPREHDRQGLSDCLPQDAQDRLPDDDSEPVSGPQAEAKNFADRLNHSRTLAWLLALALLTAALQQLGAAGLGSLNLNSIILIFMALGLALHASPRAYASAIARAIGGTAGIALQFPLYAGIMGIMADTGLVQIFARQLVSLASVHSFALLNFASAAIVNFFVPSGGGQWAVQGPISLHAALDLGLPAQQAVMSLAYGDQLTNMMQPFWALPLLGITGLKAHQIMGYSVAIMLMSAPIFMIALVF